MAKLKWNTFLVLAVIPTMSYASNWKYAGGDQEEMTFVDKDSRRDIGNRIRFWVQMKTRKDIEEYILSKKQNERIDGLVTSKMKSGYIPPYILDKQVMGVYEAEGRPVWKIMNFIGYEIAANEGAGKKVALYYVEVDRDTQMQRMLDGRMFDAQGKGINHIGIGAWEFIAPDSNFRLWVNIILR